MSSLVINNGVIGVINDFEDQLGTSNLNNFPEIVGFSGSSELSGGGNITTTYPSGIKNGDKVYLSILLEDNTTARPSLTNYNLIDSRNGSFSGSATTYLIYESNYDSNSNGGSVDFPNSYGGGITAMAVIRNVVSTDSASATFDDQSAGTSPSISVNNTSVDFTVAFCHKDTASETFTSWNVDSSQFDGEVYTLLSNDAGGSNGRAAVAAVALGEYVGPIEPGFPDNPQTGGNHGMFISGSGKIGVKNNSGIWKL